MSALSRRVRRLERKAGCARCGYPNDPPLDLLTRLPLDRVELMLDAAIAAAEPAGSGDPAPLVPPGGAAVPRQP